MKRLLLALAFTLFCLNGFSQVRTVYYDDEDHVITDSTAAWSYAIYGKLTGDSVYTYKKYDADGVVTVTGSFKDDGLKVPHGKFVYYDWVVQLSNLGYTLPPASGKERYIVVTGRYIDGKKDGKWYTFYPDGKLKNVVVFSNDIMNGEFKYFDSKGKLDTWGTYKNGKKYGEWVSGGGRKIQQFENDVATSTVKKSRKQLKEEEERAGN
jgi:hypothetical protein